MLGKLLGLASIGEALSGLHLARKFVADVMVILMLAIVGSMITGALAVAGLYECSALLMRHGLDADMAALVTGLIGVLILTLIGVAITHKIRRIQSFPLKSSPLGAIGVPVQSVVRGFYRGLTAKRPL